jgi:hypothetical protein
MTHELKNPLQDHPANYTWEIQKSTHGFEVYSDKYMRGLTIARVSTANLDENEAAALAHTIKKLPEILDALCIAEKNCMEFAKERDPDQLGTWGAIFNPLRELLGE